MTIQERADNDADPTAITPSKSDPQANLTDVPIPPSPISSPLRPIARAIAEPISMCARTEALLYSLKPQRIHPNTPIVMHAISPRIGWPLAGNDETNPTAIWAKCTDKIDPKERRSPRWRNDETNPTSIWDEYTDCPDDPSRRARLDRSDETNPMAIWTESNQYGDYVDFADYCGLAGGAGGEASWRNEPKREGGASARSERVARLSRPSKSASSAN